MLKELVKIMLIVLVFASVSGNYLYSQLQGSGTKSVPYLIFTKDELMQIENHPGTPENLKYFVLKRNIRDSVRVPIAKIENAVFDGQGYKITLAIDDTIGYLTNAALFKISFGNVEIKNLVVDGYVKGFWASAILGDAVGRDDSTKPIQTTKLINNVNLARITGTVCASSLVHFGDDYDIMIADRNINLGTCEVFDNEYAMIGGFISHFDFGNGLKLGPGGLTISNSISAGFLNDRKGNGYTAGFLGRERIWGEIYSIPETNIFKSINTSVIISKGRRAPFVLIRQF